MGAERTDGTCRDPLMHDIFTPAPSVFHLRNPGTSETVRSPARSGPEEDEAASAYLISPGRVTGGYEPATASIACGASSPLVVDDELALLLAVDASPESISRGSHSSETT